MGVAQIIAAIWLIVLLFRSIYEYGQATTSLFEEYKKPITKKESAKCGIIGALLWAAILYFGGFFSQ